MDPPQHRCEVGEDVPDLGISYAKLPNGQFLITEIVADSWASEAGFYPKDVITFVGTLDCRDLSLEEFVAEIARRPTSIELQPADDPTALKGNAVDQVFEEGVGELGLKLEGVPPGRIFIENVVVDGPADEAGMIAGDEVLSVNGEAIADMKSDTAINLTKRPLRIVAGEGAQKLPVNIIIADSSVKSLGLGFKIFPGNRIIVTKVVGGSWADTKDVQFGDEIIRLNGKNLIEYQEYDQGYVSGLFQERPFRLAVIPSIVADANEQELGLEFIGTPPGRVFVSKVDANTFASNASIQTGDEIMRLDEALIYNQTSDQFNELLAKRPLSIILQQRQRATSWPPVRGSTSVADSTRVGDLRTVVVGTGVEKLGLGFNTYPPEPLTISSVGEGGFAESVGLKAGDQIVLVGSRWCKDMSKEDLPIEIAKRPLTLWIANGPADDSDIGSGVNKATTKKFDIQEGVKSLGIGFVGCAPEKTSVNTIVDGGWAQDNGIIIQSEIVAVNGNLVSSLTKESFKEEIQKRPGVLTIKWPQGDSEPDVEYAEAGDEVAQLGVTFDSYPPDRMIVGKIKPGNWAEISGFRTGDEVVSINGKSVSELQKDAILELCRSRPLRIGFHHCEPTTDESEQEEDYFDAVAPDGIDRLGMDIAPPPSEGNLVGPILVREVTKGSWADEVGVRGGHEITTVNGISCTDMLQQDFLSALKARPAKFRFIGIRGVPELVAVPEEDAENSNSDGSEDAQLGAENPAEHHLRFQAQKADRTSAVSASSWKSRKSVKLEKNELHSPPADEDHFLAGRATLTSEQVSHFLSPDPAENTQQNDVEATSHLEAETKTTVDGTETPVDIGRTHGENGPLLSDNIEVNKAVMDLASGLENIEEVTKESAQVEDVDNNNKNIPVETDGFGEGDQTGLDETALDQQVGLDATGLDETGLDETGLDETVRTTHGENGPLLSDNIEVNKAVMDLAGGLENIEEVTKESAQVEDVENNNINIPVETDGLGEGDQTGLDETALDQLVGLDVTGLDVTGLDETGLDETGLDETACGDPGADDPGVVGADESDLAVSTQNAMNDEKVPDIACGLEGLEAVGGDPDVVNTIGASSFEGETKKVMIDVDLACIEGLEETGLGQQRMLMGNDMSADGSAIDAQDEYFEQVRGASFDRVKSVPDAGDVAAGLAIEESTEKADRKKELTKKATNKTEKADEKKESTEKAAPKKNPPKKVEAQKWCTYWNTNDMMTDRETEARKCEKPSASPAKDTKAKDTKADRKKDSIEKADRKKAASQAAHKFVRSLTAKIRKKLKVESKEKIAPTKTFRACVDVEKIGVSFATYPPARTIIKCVCPGGWAVKMGIRAGHEILSINELPVDIINQQMFKYILQKRPLVFLIALHDNPGDSCPVNGDVCVNNAAEYSQNPCTTEVDSPQEAASEKAAIADLAEPCPDDVAWNAAENSQNPCTTEVDSPQEAASEKAAIVDLAEPCPDDVTCIADFLSVPTNGIVTTGHNVQNSSCGDAAGSPPGADSDPPGAGNDSHDRLLDEDADALAPERTHLAEPGGAKLLADEDNTGVGTVNSPQNQTTLATSDGTRLFADEDNTGVGTVNSPQNQTTLPTSDGTKLLADEDNTTVGTMNSPQNQTTLPTSDDMLQLALDKLSDAKGIDQQSVVSMFFKMPNVDAGRLESDSKTLQKFEQAVHKAIVFSYGAKGRVVNGTCLQVMRLLPRQNECAQVALVYVQIVPQCRKDFETFLKEGAKSKIWNFVLEAQIDRALQGSAAVIGRVTIENLTVGDIADFTSLVDRCISTTTSSSQSNNMETEEQRILQEQQAAMAREADPVRLFQHTILSKYPSVATAWREIFPDPQNRGITSRVGLCMVARAVRFEGDLCQLWQKLDWDRSSLLSLTDLDAPGADLLRNFYRKLKWKFKSVKRAVKAMHLEGTGCKKWCKTLAGTHLAKPGEAVRLFNMLADPDPQYAQTGQNANGIVTQDGLAWLEKVSESLIQSPELFARHQLILRSTGFDTDAKGAQKPSRWVVSSNVN